MAKFKTSKDFKEFSAQVKEKLKELYSAKNMKDLGKEISNIIRIRTRLGYGVAVPEGDRFKLKELTDKYKELRRQLDLDSNTTPSRSNLTRTGQLLESIDVITVSEGQVTVGPKGSRSEGGTNEQVGKYVAEQGRPFNNLSRAEVKQVVQLLQKRLSDLVEE